MHHPHPLLLVVALLGSSASADDLLSTTAAYSSWTKHCFTQADKQICGTGITSRNVCGLLVSATLVEREGDREMTLHVTLPATVREERGVRIAIDDGPPSIADFTGCHSYACTADFAIDAELLARLKAGRALIVDVLHASQGRIRHTLSLADFAGGYGGPAKPLPQFEERVVSDEQRQEPRRSELQRQTLEEARRRAGCSPN
jgi:invasion protein IalB